MISTRPQNREAGFAFRGHPSAKHAGYVTDPLDALTGVQPHKAMDQTVARYRQMIRLAMQRRDMERVKFLVGIVVLMKGCNGPLVSPSHIGSENRPDPQTAGVRHGST
jgi:hypothetical protein